jgi:hypothetical protein
VLRRLVGDLRQVAGVRRMVLADGCEMGMEVLAFSTGGGLDFWVTAGRMLDISLLFWRGAQIAWQSPAGMPPVSVSAGSERRFEHGFGGFLNTCGFDHIRQPANGFPLHGSAPFTPARLTAYAEDWDAAEPVLYCEGEIVSWRYGGGGHRLHRRIEAPIGGREIRIRDRVCVIGSDPAPVLALYHFNLGYPIVCEGTTVRLGESLITDPLMPPENEARPSELFRASGEWANCRVASPAKVAVEFRWRTDTLPWLQLWRDLRPGCGVLSVEPCSLGRNGDGTNAACLPLEAGSSQSFAIDAIVGAPEAS